jgi:hypothetical protein
MISTTSHVLTINNIFRQLCFAEEKWESGTLIASFIWCTEKSRSLLSNALLDKNLEEKSRETDTAVVINILPDIAMRSRFVIESCLRAGNTAAATYLP